MFRTITAKFAGTCKRCGQPIQVGERIRYGGYGRTYHFADSCNQNRPVPGSQEWAETRGDDIPSYDQPGDDFDNGLAGRF